MTPVGISLITAVLAVLLMLLCPCQIKSQSCWRDGDIRLRNGSTPREGRLDLCERYWYSLCNESLGIDELQVICRELGFCTQGGKTSSNHYSVPFNSFQANCTGRGEERTGLYNSCQLGLCGYQTSVPGVNCSAEIPHTPVDVVIQVIDSYTIQVSWSPPNMSDCTDIDEYRVYCHDYSWCFYSLPTIIINSVNVSIHDYFFVEYCAYECCVSGYNSAGEGTGNCASKPLPTPPRNVSVTPVSSSLTSLLVEWVEPEQINGLFDSYQVVCGTQTSYSNSFTVTTVEVTGLSIFTTYTCCVSVQTIAMLRSAEECTNATTYLEPPTAPMDVMVTEVSANSIQLEWTTPHYNGTLSHYTIACKQARDLVWSSISAVTSEIVVNLQLFTYYTCCVSASNQAGEGNQSCVEARTQPAPPVEPKDIKTRQSTDINNLTLTWGEPAESFGQDILFYRVSCVSPLNHTIRIDRVPQRSIRVTGLNSNTNYTCCVSAVSSVGPGNSACISVSTPSQEPGKQSSLDLVAVISGGVLFALLALFVVVVITVISCWCTKKRKQVAIRNQQRSSTRADGLDKPATSTNTENAYSVHYKPDYKEEVEIRYERPVMQSNAESATGTKAAEKKKPMIPQKSCEHQKERTQQTQQDTERIYQPLVPPKTYKKPAVSSAYQDLTFETREPRSEADSSEGQYETVRRPEETNQYEPLTFGVSTPPQTDGGYQTLTKRDEGSHYQDLHSVRT